MSIEVIEAALAQSTRDRRDFLFRETPFETAERWLLGAAWALMPKRIAGIPNLLRVVAHDLIAPARALPDPARALDSPPGLAGIEHDLSIATLVEAYSKGLYPLAHLGPLKWWSPPQRSVLFFDEF